MVEINAGLDHVQGLLRGGQVLTAFKELQSIARASRDLPSAGRISQFLDTFPQQEDLYRRIRVVILRSFTIEQAVPLLRTILLARGIRAEVEVADFNQFDQYILDAGNDGSEQPPDLLIMAARLDELAPVLVSRRLALGLTKTDEVVREVIDRVEGWLRHYRTYSKAKVLLHNFALPADLSLSIYDTQSEWGQESVIDRLNSQLAQVCHRYSDVYLLNFRHLQAEVGIQHFFDNRLLIILSGEG